MIEIEYSHIFQIMHDISVTDQTSYISNYA